MTANRPVRALALLLPAFAGAPACSSLSAVEEARLEVFDTYWQALRDDYPYFGRKAIDWDELGKQYRSAVPVVERPVDFYHVLAGMLSELDDNHVSLEVPAALLATGDEDVTRLDDREGLWLTWIGGRLYVAGWPDGAAPFPPAHLPPEHRTLPEIVRVEGVPAVASMLPVLYSGPPSSAAELLLRWRDGTQTHHVLARPARDVDRSIPVTPDMNITIPPPVDFEPLGDNGLLRVRSFSGKDFETFQTAADAAVDAAIAHGGDLLVDLRGNGGGRMNAMFALASRLVRKRIRLIPDVPVQSQFFGLVTIHMFGGIESEPREPTFAGRIAVLIDGATASAAEHFARMLQLNGAILVGEPTVGIEASIREVPGPDGSTLRFGANSLLDERGRRLQDDGVHPDVSVPLRWEDVSRLGVRDARQQWRQRLLDAAVAALQRGQTSGKSGPSTSAPVGSGGTPASSGAEPSATRTRAPM